MKIEVPDTVTLEELAKVIEENEGYTIYITWD